MYMWKIRTSACRNMSSISPQKSFRSFIPMKYGNQLRATVPFARQPKSSNIKRPNFLVCVGRVFRQQSHPDEKNDSKKYSNLKIYRAPTQMNIERIVHSLKHLEGQETVDSVLAPYRETLHARHLTTVLTRLRKRKHFFLCNEVFYWSLENGISVNTIHFNCIISSLASGGHWEKARSLFQEMEGRGLVADMFTFSSLISACAHARQLEAAQEAYDSLLSRGLEPNTVVYNAMLSAYEKCGEEQQALRLLRTMRQGPGSSKADTLSFNAVVRALVRAGRMIEAEGLVRELESLGGVGEGVGGRRRRGSGSQHPGPDNRTYHALLAGLEPGAAFAIPERMKRYGCVPCTRTFNQILQACIRAGATQEAWEVFGAMGSFVKRGDGVSRSAVSFARRRALGSTATPRDDLQVNPPPRNTSAESRPTDETPPGAAISENPVPEQPKQSNSDQEQGAKIPTSKNEVQPPTPCATKTADSAAVPEPSWSVNGTVRDIQPWKVMRDRVTYNTMMNLCAKGGGDGEGAALRLLEQMINAGVRPDVVSFTSALDACAQERNWLEAERVWEDAIRSGIIPNEAMMSRRISALGRGGEWERALKAWEEFRYTHSGGAAEHTGLLNAVLFACARAGEWKQAETVWKSSPGVSKDQTSYGALISAYGRGEQWEAALELFESLEDSEAEFPAPDLMVYNCILDALARGRQCHRARGVFQEMDEASPPVTPDLVSFNCLISAYERCSEWKNALEAYEEMKLANIAPSTITFSCLVRVCIACGQWTIAIELLDEMFLAEVTPNSTFLESIITCIHLEGQDFNPDARWRFVSKVLSKMEKHGVEMDEKLVDRLVQTMP